MSPNGPCFFTLTQKHGNSLHWECGLLAVSRGSYLYCVYSLCVSRICNLLSYPVVPSSLLFEWGAYLLDLLVLIRAKIPAMSNKTN